MMEIRKRLFSACSVILALVMLLAIVLPVSADAPVLDSLSRNDVKLGAKAFKLVLEGSGFMDGAVVMWGATELVPQKIKPEMIQVLIAKELLAVPGIFDVMVKNPDATLSNALPFKVIPPKPQIVSLTPRKVYAESNATGQMFELKIVGRSFLPDSTVSWYDPKTLVTTPLTLVEPCTPRKCFVTVDKSLISEKNNPKIRVTNAFVNSNPKTLSVMIHKPVLTGMDPATVVAGSGPITLTLTGNYFMANAYVKWNGVVLAGPVTYIDRQHISVEIPADLLAKAGTFKVKVAVPGGGWTKELPFKVTAP